MAGYILVSVVSGILLASMDGVINLVTGLGEMLIRGALYGLTLKPAI